MRDLATLAAAATTIMLALLGVIALGAWVEASR